MAITILGCTNASIRCGESSIPVIKVTIAAGETSERIDSTFFESVYAMCGGFVATVSTYFSKDTPAGLQTLTRGRHTIGGDTGFKISFSVWPNSGNVRGIDNLKLYYNNNVVCSASAYTGYSPVECVYIVIFVDSNNNIYHCGPTNATGLYLLYSSDPGVTVSDDVAIAPVVSGYSLWQSSNYNGVLFPSQDNITNDIDGESEPDTDDDPYQEGGDSEEGGGDGDFTDETEDIDFPVEPTLSAADTKFITLYNPSKAQLDNLASYMWSTGFDLDTFKKLFADPMQCILGLSIVPVNVPSGGTRTVTVGNISTGVSMTVASKQYVTLDCGSINVKKYWGAYLDYDPYTKAEIYLPYIGIHSIATDDIMGKSVHVLYRVDILSGACTAFVKCGGSVLYQFTGACASSIPVTGNDWTNVINGALTIAGSIGTMVATGGATAPMAVGAIASTCTNSLKPNIEKSGSMGGTGGLMGGQKPYLILTRPVQAKPKNQNKYLGYPSFITSKVKNLKGFTIFESIRLSNIPATEQEIEELSNLLESGVIL